MIIFFQYYLLTGDAAMSNVFSCSIKRREKKTDWKVKPTWCKQYEKKTLHEIYKGSKKMREKLIKKNKSEIDENGR